MFGSIVLEVLIGLVLVYLLLSLVCSTIQEAIASWRDWRGEMLRMAISRLFEEKDDTTRGREFTASLWNKLRARIASWMGSPPAPVANAGGEAAATNWTHEIYEHPLIDSLHKDASRYPSYIPNAVFADALIDLIVRGKDAATPPLSPTDRLLAVMHAVSTKTSADGQLRMNDKVAATLSLLMERARQRVASAATDAAVRMLEAFKEEISGWYENTMNRATGWYRRRTQFVQFLLAAVTVIATNSDTVMIGEQLAKDPKAREAAANAATQVLANQAVRDAVTAAPKAEDKPKSETAPGKDDTPTDADRAKAEQEKIKRAFQQFAQTTQEAQIRVGWPDPALEVLKEEHKQERALDAEKAKEDVVSAGADLPWYQDLQLWLDGEGLSVGGFWLFVFRKALGLAVTICAVALGAPFWFQMLEKLVKVRGSGNREVAADATASPAPGAPTAGAPAVTVAVGSTPASTASIAAVAAAALPVLEKLDDRYWSNFTERWKESKRTSLPVGTDEATERAIAAFLARMAALAYEPKWTVRARLEPLGVKVDDPKEFMFFDVQGTQAFAFKLGADVIVAYRGTEPSKIDDILADARFALKKNDPYSGQVHSGFAEAIGVVFDAVDGWIDAQFGADLASNGRVFLTGHSLGAALATLHFDRRTGAGKRDPKRHELVTFGSPRVGDREFWTAFEGRLGFAKPGDKRATRVLRFVNNRDLVTRVAPRSLKFEHVGAECYIDSDGRIHVGEKGFEKWTDFTLLVLDGLMEFKAALKKPIGDHSMDLYVRRLENWNGWRA